jgi:predicted PurR-regulated permease PerM
MEPKHLSISWEVVWKLLFVVVVGWILFSARDVIVALLLSIVISAAFNPAVTFLERKRIPRILGALLIYLIAIVAIGFILYSFVPLAITELTNFLEQSGEFLGPTLGTLNTADFIAALNFNLEKLNDLLFSGSISLADLTSRFLGGVIFAITIFVLSFYLTVGRDGVEKFLTAILPSAYEEKAISIYGRVSRKIGRWLTGQIFLSFVVGLTTYLGLWLLGVRYSLFIGILAALAELVPYAGPIFTGSIAVLAALSDSLSKGVYTFLLFLVVQQLENHLLTPTITRYTTSLNPVVVLASLLIGAQVFGPIGLVLAVPIAVFFQELLEDWAEAKQSRRGMI